MKVQLGFPGKFFKLEALESCGHRVSGSGELQVARSLVIGWALSPQPASKGGLQRSGSKPRRRFSSLARAAEGHRERRSLHRRRRGEVGFEIEIAFESSPPPEAFDSWR